MNTSYKELIAQREALDAQIKAARDRELADALEKVRTLIREYELKPEEVFPQMRSGRPMSASAGTKVAPKYRNPATGETWTGRGKPPRWIQDQNREQFLIA